MEEELARLDKAYEKVARIAEDGANSMINTQKLLEKVRPEYQKKMREIEAQRADRKLSCILRHPTADFAEQNGRNAKLIGHRPLPL